VLASLQTYNVGMVIIRGQSHRPQIGNIKKPHCGGFYYNANLRAIIGINFDVVVRKVTGIDRIRC